MTARSRFGTMDLLSLATLLGTLGLTTALYARLPAQVPLHFDIHGRPDGWAPRALGAWLLPLFAFLTAAVVRFAPALMRREWRERLEGSPTSGTSLVVVFMLCALHLVVLRAALTPGADVGPMLAAVLGATWIALGQLMPRTRRNPIMGVRTRWTLASDENWARTHRVAGIAFTVGGVVGLLAAALSSATVAIVAILVSGLYPLLWSVREKRRTA